MSFIFEKNKLYAYLGKDLVETMKAYKAFIAGGTITSLFTNKEINDIDIYFRCEEDAIGFLADIWEESGYVVSHTNKATQIMYGKKIEGINIQLIHFNYFKNATEIFEQFDFTSCMGCFDFEKEEFALHSDFLKHNAQRILKFNSATAYPIVSLLRVKKYEDKGFRISKPEFIRIALTCMNLNINTYEELKDHLGGMYGINYDKLFEDVDDEEFDLQEAVDKIADIALSEDYFIKPTPVEFKDLDELAENISTKPKKYMNINDTHVIIDYKGLLRTVEKAPENKIDIDPNTYFEEVKFYKFVKKTGEKYKSFYDRSFEYIIGDTVEAKESTYSWAGSHSGKLHFSEKREIRNAEYDDRDGAVLIEVKINKEDFVEADDGHILAKKCFVIREVPEEEYEGFKNKRISENDELVAIFGGKNKKR
ncbi:hypothetical protein [Priestia flexa]|uniref:hypothetical protein n=1 Tax=Priestia flexa TaxID=86664 RepID=UPI00047388D2|nr:hypothetical protein [Priestia flexa]